MSPTSHTAPPADAGLQDFERHRPRLFGLAYRMLGQRAEAEDLVQDVWLRWQDSERTSIAQPEAWLVTTATRLAIDRLRRLRVEREHYAGFWLPEPLVQPWTEAAPSAEELLEQAHDVSTALLFVLEQLTPEERAAFLLREVFDADYAEVAQALGRSEAACRQLVHRARAHVKAGRPRFEAPAQAHAELLRRFAQAARGGDLAQIQALFAPDAALISDGGGKVASFGHVLETGRRLALLDALHAWLGPGAVNAKLLRRRLDQRPAQKHLGQKAAQAYDRVDGRGHERGGHGIDLGYHDHTQVLRFLVDVGAALHQHGRIDALHLQVVGGGHAPLDAHIAPHKIKRKTFAEHIAKIESQPARQ